MSERVEIISLEGNIGSGKTTLLNELKARFATAPNVIFLKEPVDEWEKIKDSNGKTMLEKFYADPKTYSFPFQMMAYISRLKILKNSIKTALENTSGKVYIITERSLYTDKYVFAKMLFERGDIEDVCYNIYMNWFDEFAEDYIINKIVYVNTKPQICHERISKRARLGESIIPLDYLVECNKYHDEYIRAFNQTNTNIMMLDGNADIYTSPDTLTDWIKCINVFLEL